MTHFVYNSKTAHEDFPDWKFLFENYYLVLSGIDKTDTTKNTIRSRLRHYRTSFMQGDKLVVKLLKAMDDPPAATLRNPDGGNGDVLRTKARRLIKIQVGHHETKGWRITLRLCDQIGKPMAKLVGWHRDDKFSIKSY
jgi:hypothetical protein